MRRMRFKIAFQSLKFWFWIYSLWVPESSIWCCCRASMEWASKGLGALWLFTAYWGHCLWQLFWAVAAVPQWFYHQWVRRKGQMVTAQPGILSAGSSAGSWRNGTFQWQALLTVLGSSCLNFPWCSLHTAVIRERGTLYVAIMYCPCLLAWFFFLMFLISIAWERKKWTLQCPLSVKKTQRGVWWLLAVRAVSWKSESEKGDLLGRLLWTIQEFF